MVALAGVYAVFAVAAMLAWWVVGDAWWNQLVNLTTFWWALPSLPLLLLALVFRQWGIALLLVVPAGVLVWAYGGLFVPSAAPPSTVAPSSAAPSSATPASGAELRVTSYNVFIQVDDVSHVVDLVEANQPDVVLLQEVAAERVDRLRERVADQLPHGWFGDSANFGGVGVLSRHPIGEVRPVWSPERFERPTAVLTLDVPTNEGPQPVQVVPLHLVAACPVCGPFVERQRYEVASRHREVQAVLDALDPELPAIVGGDLNGTRLSQAHRTLTGAGFRDPHRDVGFGLGFTYPADHAPPGRANRAGTGTSPRRATVAHLPLVSFPVLRLDHILVRHLVPLEARVGDARASDHRPIHARLRLPADGDGAS